jgi:hypothetical protein
MVTPGLGGHRCAQSVENEKHECPNPQSPESTHVTRPDFDHDEEILPVTKRNLGSILCEVRTLLGMKQRLESAINYMTIARHARGLRPTPTRRPSAGAPTFSGIIVSPFQGDAHGFRLENPGRRPGLIC